MEYSMGQQGAAVFQMSSHGLPAPAFPCGTRWPGSCRAPPMAGCGSVARRLRAMGIRDRPIAPRSPWQNGCAERLIGSIRRDCLDHVVVFGERHLRHLLKSYQKYYQRGPHPLITAEGRADPPRRPDRRADVGRANFGWAAPPIYPSVSFRQGQEHRAGHRAQPASGRCWSSAR
jgi:hypothetical protein